MQKDRDKRFQVFTDVKQEDNLCLKHYSKYINT